MYKGYTVLFVDDEINVLNSLKRGLFDEEYNCLFANSGKEALEILEQEEVAVVVTDMKMPIMTGLQLLVIVQEKYPDIVSVILSGYTQLQQILVTINQVDIFKFITKPWKMEEEFKLVIHKALDYFILKEENKLINDRLKVQNKAYQEILGRIDATISEGKRIVKLIGDISVGMISYNEDFYPFKHLEPKTVFLYEKTIFNHLTNEMLYNIEKKKVGYVFGKIYGSLDDYLITEYIKQDHPKVDVEVHWHMVIGMIRSIISLFEAEFAQYGLTYIEGYDHQSNPTISLVTKNIFEANDENKLIVGAANEKKSLLENTFNKVSEYSFVEYGAVVKSDKTVFVLKL